MDGLKQLDLSEDDPYFKAYNPRGLRVNNGCLTSSWIFLALGLVSVALVARSDDGWPPAIFLFMFLCFFFGIARKILVEIKTDANAKWEKHHLAVRDELTAQASIKQAKAMDDAQAKALGKQIINQVFNISASGHATVNSTVVSGDLLNDSIKELSRDDPKLEAALQTIAGYVSQLGSDQAKAAFNDFNKNVKDKSSAGTLRALWKEAIALLPDAVKITEAAVAIGKVLGA
jgi:hypothetical protein